MPELTKIQTSIQPSEFRKNLARYLSAAKKEPVIIGAVRGGGARVVLSTDIYNKLIDAYENFVDARMLEKLVADDTGVRIPWRPKKHAVRSRIHKKRA